MLRSTGLRNTFLLIHSEPQFYEHSERTAMMTRLADWHNLRIVVLKQYFQLFSVAKWLLQYLQPLLQMRTHTVHCLLRRKQASVLDF